MLAFRYQYQDYSCNFQTLEDLVESAEYAGVIQRPLTAKAFVLLRHINTDGHIHATACPWQDFKRTKGSRFLIDAKELELLELKYG